MMKLYKTDSRAVRLGIFVLIAACCLHARVPATGQGTGRQNERISLEMPSATFVQVFGAVEKNNGYSFIWAKDLTEKLDGKISVNVSDKTIGQFMDIILKGTGLSYKLMDRQVMIVEQEEKAVRQGTITVSGTVISSTDNKPVVGATVHIEGTNIGVMTDWEGNYKLDVPSGYKEVTFSCLGYDSKKLSVDEPLLFRLVTLVEQSNVLEDVVVIGFGVQKKESLVGAVQSVKPSDLKMSTSNLSSSFAGKVAGLISVQSSGQPGADGASFWIRGISTFGSNKTPLIILDGVEIDQTILNSVAPETIEQFSILKDATATALYGSRGANGVMIVTTKSGRNSEKMTVNLRVENGWAMPTRITKVTSGVGYMENYNEARVTRGFSPHYTEDKIENTRLGLDPYVFPDVDWYKLMFRNFSMNQNINANVTGGSRKIDYFLNVSVHNENGMLRNTSHSNYSSGENMQKYTFQSNVGASVTNTTRLSLKMTTQLMNRYGTSAVADDLFSYTMIANPVDFPAYYPAGEGDDHVRFGNAPSWDGGATQINPYAILNQGYCNKFWSNVLATISLDQDLSFFTKGLSVSGLFSFRNYVYNNVWNQMTPYYYTMDTYWQNAEGGYDYQLSSIGAAGSNYLTAGTSNSGNRIFNIQGKADYYRSFGHHDLSATLVYHQMETRRNVPGANQNDILPYREQGFAGRFTYSFDTRYLFEANFGYNGSENFAKGHRWGFFPSVAVGWVISNEKFFAPARDVLSLLKIRASYGLVGNDALPDRFPYVTNVMMSSDDNEFKAYFGETGSAYRGVQVTAWGNEQATWEKSKKINLGLEVGLFNDFMLIADAFHENRTGIFMQRRAVPSTSGFQESTPYANIGRVLNRGIDMSLEYNNAVTKDFIVSVQGTFTYAHNEVKARDEPHYQYAYQGYVGKPVNAIYGLVASGLFSSDEQVKRWPTQDFGSNVLAGDIRYLDLNGDGVVDGNDRTSIGYPTVPEITYGIGASLRYKGWDFSFFFQGTGRVSLLMSNHHPFLTNVYSGRNMVQWIADDHWSESNPNVNAAYPRLSPVWNVNNTQTSSFWVKNGSYLRLKNVEAGYSWNSFRFYVTGTNLLTFSKFKYWDPELGNGNGLSYPLQRTAKIGVQYHF